MSFRQKVPTIESSLGLNLARLNRAARKLGSNLLTVEWGGKSYLVVLEPGRLTLLADGRSYSADIIAFPCLGAGGRLQSYLKCDSPHEAGSGLFRRLYFIDGRLACRHCHQLRYSTRLAHSAGRVELRRTKVMSALHCADDGTLPPRRPGQWHSTYLKNALLVAQLNSSHYANLKRWLTRPN